MPADAAPSSPPWPICSAGGSTCANGIATHAFSGGSRRSTSPSWRGPRSEGLLWDRHSCLSRHRQECLCHTSIAHRAEFVARLPVRHRRCVRRFPSEPVSELRHLHSLGPVPVRIELVARLVIAMLAIIVGHLLAPLFSFADDVLSRFD